MNILVTDDHQIFRSSFITLLKAIVTTPCQYHEAKNGKEALSLIEQIHFHLVFLDVSMPVMNGYETCKQIIAKPNHPPIIMLTQHSKKIVVSHFRGIGVSFITKNAEVTDITEAISNTLAGKQYIEKSLQPETTTDVNLLDLTPQEKALISKLQSGKSSKEISALLHLTPKTVDTYRERLLRKLKVKNVAELISFVFNTGNDQG